MYEEYVAKKGDRVKISKIGEFHISGASLCWRNFYPPEGISGTIIEDHIDVSPPGICAELEAKIKWDNGVEAQYPLSFLKKVYG